MGECWDKFASWWTRERFLGVILFVIWLISLGIGASILDIMEEENKLIVSGDGECEVPTPTEFTLEKQSDQYHWRYNILEFSGFVRKMCYTIRNDAIMYWNGVPIARSDGKFLSFISYTPLYDCHKRTFATLKSGSIWDELINNHWVSVSLVISDANDQPVGFVRGNKFLVDDFAIEDLNGNTAATLYRNTMSFQWWQWHIKQFNVSSPLADIRLLSLIAGKRSFSDTDNNDVCNNYVFQGGIAALCFIIGVPIFALIWLVEKYRDQLRDCKNNVCDCFRQCCNKCNCNRDSDPSMV